MNFGIIIVRFRIKKLMNKTIENIIPVYIKSVFGLGKNNLRKYFRIEQQVACTVRLTFRLCSVNDNFMR